jgi:HPt (histidine-containing phosphotransfer) domain-containing protein
MSPDPTVDISEQLDALRVRFIGKTRQQLQDLGDMVRRIRDESATGSDLDEMYQMLHRLAGSSGTFGFDALGHQARELEQQVKPLVELARETTLSPESMAAVIGPRFERAVGSLDTLLRSAARVSEHVSGSSPIQETEARPDTHESRQLAVVWPPDEDAAEHDSLCKGLEESGFSACRVALENLQDWLASEACLVVLCHDSLVEGVAERLQL